MNSSSLHKLNADRKLSKFQRWIWFVFNRINNSLLPNWKAPELQIRHFHPKITSADWESLAPKSSPSRVLSDLFWMQLPWERIYTELGSIHVFDTGCGSGRYGEKLQAFAHGKIAGYFGTDESAYPEWPERMQKNQYIQLSISDSKDILKHIPANTNLFISQSAIEHFPEDLAFFRQIRSFIDNQTKPILQVHLFPSAVCLDLYRYHGIRQYTPRTISYISTLFANSRSILFELGNAECNQLHFEFISNPVFNLRQIDRRDSEAEKYRELLKLAIASQNNQGSQTPSFYALIIHSNPRTVLFNV